VENEPRLSPERLARLKALADARQQLDGPLAEADITPDERAAIEQILTAARDAFDFPANENDLMGAMIHLMRHVHPEMLACIELMKETAGAPDPNDQAAKVRFLSVCFVAAARLSPEMPNQPST